MAIFFRCQCGTSFNFPETLAGKLGKCKKCGKSITVPDPSKPKTDLASTTVTANDNTQVVDENNSSSGVIATLTLCCFSCCLITAWWGYGQLGLAVQPQSSETQPSSTAAQTRHSFGSLFTQSELEKARQMGIEQYEEEMALKKVKDKAEKDSYEYWKPRIFEQWWKTRGTTIYEYEVHYSYSEDGKELSDSFILENHADDLGNPSDEIYKRICQEWDGADGDKFRETLMKAEEARIARLKREAKERKRQAEEEERWAEEQRRNRHVYYQFTCRGCGAHGEIQFAYGYAFDKVKDFRGDMCDLCGAECYFKELSSWEVDKIRRQKKADFDKAIGGDEDFKNQILEMNKKIAF